MVGLVTLVIELVKDAASLGASSLCCKSLLGLLVDTESSDLILSSHVPRHLVIDHFVDKTLLPCLSSVLLDSKLDCISDYSKLPSVPGCLGLCNLSLLVNLFQPV